MTTGFTMTIAGDAIAGASEYDVLDPADETVAGRAPVCSPEQLDQAVAAARAALPGWSATPFEERRKLVLAVADAVEAQLEPLKRLLTREQGKSLDDAAGEILGFGYWLRGTASLSLPETVNEDSAERLSVTHRVPLGVVGAIVPWNYPLGNAGFKLAPALLAGNTVVWKPSPFTPLTTLKVGEILRDVLPPGVLNVVSGDAGLGPRMTEHPGIDMISYTGSTRTGRQVMSKRGAHPDPRHPGIGRQRPRHRPSGHRRPGRRREAVLGAFANSGQVCLAIKRLYIHRDVYEPLKQALAAYAGTVRMGPGTEAGVRLGPVQNRPQYDRILSLLDDSRAQGHTFAIGGLPQGEGQGRPGYFVPLTLVDNPRRIRASSRRSSSVRSCRSSGSTASRTPSPGPTRASTDSARPSGRPTPKRPWPSADAWRRARSGSTRSSTSPRTSPSRATNSPASVPRADPRA